MKEFLQSLLAGKVSYLSALGLVLTAAGGFYVGLLTPLEAIGLVLTGTGVAGVRRAVSNSHTDILKVVLQAAIDAERAKADKSPPEASP